MREKASRGCNAIGGRARRPVALALGLTLDVICVVDDAVRNEVGNHGLLTGNIVKKVHHHFLRLPTIESQDFSCM